MMMTLSHLKMCDKLSCEEDGHHCCVDDDDPKNVTCCDVDEFIDKHIMIPSPEHIFHNLFTPPMRRVTKNEKTTTTPMTDSTLAGDRESSTALPEANAEIGPHALGWTYIGVASGVIVLLLFVLVMLTIIYILYHWRRKYGQGRRFSYMGPRGHEVVVYTSSGSSGRQVDAGPRPATAIHTERTNTELPTTSTSQGENAPPPYTPPPTDTSKAAISNREDEIQIETIRLQNGQSKSMNPMPN